MGCVGSKRAGDVNDKHPNVFRVEGEGEDGDHWNGQLEVTSTNLTLYRKRKPPTQWPLQCLRRYGYENDTFIFEAGRRCKTGEGIYSFRCRRADVLFNLLQDYIQESTYNNNNNNNMTVNSLDEVQQSQERMDADVAELRRALVSQQTTNGSNYIILHGNNSTAQDSGGSGGPTQIPCSSSTSPGRGGGRMAMGNSTSPCNSPQNVLSGGNNNNYLEPVDGTSPTPLGLTNPSSSNNSNIYTNSMMIPQQAAGANGNVYQQLALAQSSPASGSMKQQQSGTVESSPAGTPGSVSGGRPLITTTTTTNESLMRVRMSQSTDEGLAGQSQTTSPVTLMDDPLAAAAAQQQLNTYMNVTPGEMVLLASSNTNSVGTTSNHSWRFSRMNSNASATAISERCYENMDAAVLSAALGGGSQLSSSTSSHAITISSLSSGGGGGGNNGRATGGRHSRPDIFSKVDLPMMDGGAAALRMSEPCTPTSTGGGGGGGVMGSAQQRKVNYIVLDLDSSQSGTSSSASGSAAGAVVGNGASISSNLLTPESPTKKRQQTLGYATIDFNKTVALSNSTNPTCDSEASRKTRF